MNFRKLTEVAAAEGFDIINIYAMSKGIGVRVSLESRNPESAAVSLFELLNVKFGSPFIRQAMEEREALVGAGWDISFDEKSMRLRRLTMTEIMSVFEPNSKPAQVA